MIKILLKRQIIIILLFLCFIAVRSTAENFYIDTQDDFNEYKNAAFEQGDVIYFLKGVTFEGAFSPNGSGAAGSPIKIASYGDSNDKPVIDGLNSGSVALNFSDQEYWEISGLEIINSYCGIEFKARNKLFLHHIYISDCDIHDVAYKGINIVSAKKETPDTRKYIYNIYKIEYLHVDENDDVNTISYTKPATYWEIGESNVSGYKWIKNVQNGKYLRYVPPGGVVSEELHEDWDTQRWEITDLAGTITIRNQHFHEGNAVYLRWSDSANDVVCSTVELDWESYRWKMDYFGPKLMDVQIKDNDIIETGNRGIEVRNFYYEDSNHPGFETRLSFCSYYSDVVIKGNNIERTCSNGLVVWGAMAPEIEYNTLIETAYEGNGQAMFVAFTKNALIQYNECYETKSNEGQNDAGGIGLDYFGEDTICQYNYVHDNDWGGIVIMAKNKNLGQAGAVVRYNICRNNCGGLNHERKAEIRISGPVKHCKIYNNIFYTPGGEENGSQTARMIFENEFDPFAGWPEDIDWYNNIFYFVNNEGSYVFGNGDNHFHYNCFYGYHPSSEPDDDDKITDNPLLVNAGSGGKDIDWDDPDVLSGYRLCSNSPCINSGKALSENGDKDFWGNPLYSGGSADIGVYEGAGTYPRYFYDHHFLNKYEDRYLNVNDDNDVGLATHRHLGTEWSVEVSSGDLWLRNANNEKYLRHIGTEYVICEDVFDPYESSIKWEIEWAETLYFWIKNHGSGSYLRWSDSVNDIRCTGIQSDWDTPKWMIYHTVKKRILNYEKVNLYVDNDNDVIASGNTNEGVYWEFIDSNVSGYVWIRNMKNGRYLRYSPSSSDGVICSDTLHTDWSSQRWEIDDSNDSGWKIIRNQYNNKFLRKSGNDIICSDIEPGWDSYKWKILEF